MITISDVKEYQNKVKKVKTIGEFKAVGRELRDKFNLTDRQAIDILNNKADEISEILESQKNNNLKNNVDKLFRGLINH